MKTTLLAHMLKICKKHKNLILNPISWRTFWQNALDIACRNKKDQSLASENPIIAYMTKLVEFLHGSRRYLIRTREECDILIDEAMEKLKDLRQVLLSFDGLLMMLNCLPTDYSGYDSVLPKWVALWCSISHNVQWDMCWLTLLLRARKYTVTYDWKPLLPLLISKSRELLGLPGATGGRENGAVKDALVFPNFYFKLITDQVDAHDVSLNKLAKLIYFTTICDEITDATVFILTDPLNITTPKLNGINSNEVEKIPGYNCPGKVLPIIADIVLFFQSIRPFYYAGNVGGWIHPVAYFITSFACKCFAVNRSYDTIFISSFYLPSISSSLNSSHTAVSYVLTKCLYLISRD